MLNDLQKEFTKAITDIVLKRILWWLSLSSFVALSISYASLMFANYDSTDNGSKRSGLKVLTDARTGCQYLTTKNGGLTPRLGVKCGDKK